MPDTNDLVDLFIDLQWRKPVYSNDPEEWESLTDEQKKAIERHVAGDMEMLSRYPDPWRGGTPLEYLAAKDEQQRMLRAS